MKRYTVSPYSYWGESDWIIRKSKYGDISEYQGWLTYTIGHRMPDWMPVKLHLTLERLIQKIPHPMRQLPIICHLYHLFYGLICGFSMRIIVPFLREVEINLFPTARFLILDRKLIDTNETPKVTEITTGQTLIHPLPSK